MARGERSESLAPVEAGSVPAGREAGRALLPAGFRLEPHGVGEMLDVALEVFRQRFLALAGTAFVLMAGSEFLQLWIRHRSEALADRGDDRAAILLALLEIPILFLTSLVVAAATSRLAYSTLEGRPISAWASLAVVLKKLPFLLMTAILEFVALVAGFFALVLPAVFLTWKFALASTVVVLEDVSPVRALSRSWTLTRGLFPLAFAVLLLGQLLFFPFHFSSFFENPEVRRDLLSQLGVSLSGIQADLIPTLVLSLLGAVGMAYQAVLVTLFYVEARIRREGFDLHVSLERLALRAAEDRESEHAAGRARDRGTPSWEGLA
jgi:hypothetical protein